MRKATVFQWHRLGMKDSAHDGFEEYVRKSIYDELLYAYNQLLSNNEVNKAVMADIIERNG